MVITGPFFLTFFESSCITQGRRLQQLIKEICFRKVAKPYKMHYVTPCLIFFYPDIKKPVWPLQMAVTRDCSNFATRSQTTRRPSPLGTYFPTRKGLPENLLWLSWVRMVIVYQMRPHPLRHFYFVTQQSPPRFVSGGARRPAAVCAHTISICAARLTHKRALGLPFLWQRK